MNWTSMWVAAACSLAAAGVTLGKEPAAKPTEAKPVAAKPEAGKPAPTATSAPTDVLATVGTAKITRQRVEAPLKSAPADFPAERLAAARQKILSDLIVAELLHTYLQTHKVECPEKDMKELKERIAKVAAERKTTPEKLLEMGGMTEDRLKDQVRMKKLAEKTIAKAKVDAFVKAHPACFNGTKVQASHVLIACVPTASTADQTAAITKLEKIAADVKAGKVSFADVAKEHSACPSGKKAGGDLGEFAFSAMVPPFALQAFRMKIGEVSGVVRTQFGFHIITVTKRTEGTGKPGDDVEKTAQSVLLAELQNRVFDQALTTCPIMIANK